MISSSFRKGFSGLSRSFAKMPTKKVVVSALTDSVYTNMDVGHGFYVESDQPKMMNGTNKACTPLDLNIASLLACENSTMRFIANKQDIEIGNANFTIEGEVNLEGFMTGSTKAYWDKIIINVELETSASEEQIEKLMHDTSKRCPVASMMMALEDIEVEENWKIVDSVDFQPPKKSLMRKIKDKMFKLFMK